MQLQSESESESFSMARAGLSVFRNRNPYFGGEAGNLLSVLFHSERSAKKEGHLEGLPLKSLDCQI